MASKKNSITLCITGPEGVSRQSLTEVDSVILGSGAGVAVKIPDPHVSNFHVMLKVDAQGNVKAIDLGSENGTRIGENPILGPTPLNHGDVLTLGRSQVQVLFGDETATRPLKVEVPGPNRATQVPAASVSFSSERAPAARPPTAPASGGNARVIPQAPVIPSVSRPRSKAPGTAPGALTSVGAQSAAVAPMLFGGLEPEAASAAKDRVLQVAMMWGDQVLNVQQFSEGVPVTIGENPANAFQFYAPTVGSAFTLAAANGLKRTVHVPADANVVVSTKRGLKKAEGNALELDIGDRVQVSVDELSFVLQYVKAAPQMPRGRRQKQDKIFGLIALLVLAIGAGLLGALLASKHAETVKVVGQADQNLVRFIYKHDQLKKKEIARKQKLEEQKGAEEGKKAKDEEGALGKVAEQKERPAEASKAGTPLTDAQKKERDRQKVNNTGLLALLGKDQGSISNIRGPGGHGGGLNEALGGLRTGGVLGNQGGLGGLGSKGTGKGGGGTGLTIGGLGTKGDGPGLGGSGFDLNRKGKDTVRVIPGKTIIEGGLPKDVIAQIVRSHEKEIKYCYELELNKDPSLTGKVAAFWIIDASGAVSEANAAESTLNSDPAERCMMQKIKRWKFPEPKGGGIVTVTYAWVFKPNAGEE